jgi:HPt (histidine-containing phosphotransfer) domain-containing protein
MGTVTARGEDGDASAQLAAAMRVIGIHARTVNLGRAERLADVLARADNGALDDSARQTATELAHQLVGSAGTFGFVGASDLAGELEQFFADGGFDDRSRLDAARSTLHRLQQALHSEPVLEDEPAYQRDDRDPEDRGTTS